MALLVLRPLLGACLVSAGASTGYSRGRSAALALHADDACRADGAAAACAPATSLLQVQAGAADRNHHRQKAAVQQPTSRNLAFVHVPCNFGHTVEGVALEPEGAHFLQAAASFKTEDREAQWKHIRAAAGPDGEFWGQINPDLRRVSEATGCDLFYTPQTLWPEDLLTSYFGNKTVFGLLRNPYDRVVNEFRMQLMVYSSFFTGETRADVSSREGHLEKEREPYLTWYDTCDVNAWVKAELAKYKAGDRFRGNCHLLPQAEFFRGKYGISLALDVTGFPTSFNKAMEDHGYDIRTNGFVGHNTECAVSAFSLDEEALALVREVYAQDFDLNCRHLGLCDAGAKSCVCAVPGMCGEAPAGYCASPA